MVRWIRRCLASIALATAVIAAAGGGAAATGWQAPVDAAGPGGWSFVDVAIDAQGGAVAVWRRFDGDGGWSVVAARRPSGGRWSPPVAISAGDDKPSLPTVAVDPTGNAVAVWKVWRADLAAERIRVASSRAGGGWSEPVSLADDGGFIASGAQVAIDADGRATVVWSQVVEYGGGYVVRAASRAPDGAWSEPADLSDRDRDAAGDPQVAVGADGAATAVWLSHLPGDARWVVQSASRPRGGSWSAEPADLSAADGVASGPRAVIDAGGDVTAAWSRRIDDRFAVEAARRVAGGSWTAPVELSRERAARIQSEVDLAVDPAGRVTAVWSAFEAGGYVVRSSMRTPADGWSAPVDLSARDGSDDPVYTAPDPHVAVDPQGDVTATWRTFAGARRPGSPIYEHHFRSQAARRPSGGGWSAPVDLAPVREGLWSPELAVDPQGHVTALWVEPLGSPALLYDSVVRSRVFDPVAPELRGLAVPASGVVGAPVAMSVDPFDLWSPVAVSWQFGDGTSAAGTALSHCFSAPGTQTIAITATDAAANTTSTMRTIEIAADPALPPDRDPCARPDDDGTGGGGAGGGGTGGGRTDDGGAGDGTRSGEGDRSDRGERGGSGSGGESGTERRRRTRPTPRPTTRRAPRITKLRQSNRRWRTRPATRRPRLPVGTTFRFRLNRPATVRLTFTQLASGRRTGRRCTTPRCRRTIPRGTLTLRGRTGANARAFDGTIHRRTLPPGRYRLTATAGGQHSTAATLGFTIVR